MWVEFSVCELEYKTMDILLLTLLMPGVRRDKHVSAWRTKNEAMIRKRSVPVRTKKLTQCVISRFHDLRIV